MQPLNRRDFQSNLLGSALAFGLIECLWRRDLFADDVKPDVGKWFRDLNSLGKDLQGQKLKDVEFQAKMEELYKRVDLPALLQFVELDKIAARIKIPDNGAFSAGFSLSQVDGLDKAITFGKQIFCLKKGRAVVPHGHENMCTGFIVMRGMFRGRHYDRVETKPEYYVIKPTIDREFKPGELSTISDHKDNVHWFACTSETGFIFNAHFDGYDPAIKSVGRLYIDPEGEKLSGGLIKAPKMTSGACHKKYG